MYNVFVQLCEKNGVSTYKVCKDLGISQGTISNWKHRGNNLSASILKKIADYFGVSVDTFFGNIEWEPKTQEIIETDIEADSENKEYYVDENTLRMAKQIQQNKELSLLFDTAKTSSAEDLQTIHAMLLALKKKENKEND